MMDFPFTNQNLKIVRILRKHLFAVLEKKTCFIDVNSMESHILIERYLHRRAILEGQNFLSVPISEDQFFVILLILQISMLINLQLW